ncbi:MAG TPA: hypothetical protein DDX54_03080 [Rhodospirillaceae bacterium]|jgi:hypothetical protein|nr:hypothetical protein [Alphaproteobacteria bacterium]HBH26367.1 hypothetical protein [Rhodospirillaceae bacterium]
MLKYIKKLYLTAGAGFTAGVLAASPASAGGGTNTFSTIAGHITDSVQNLPGLIAVFSTLMGLLIGVMGVFKIKDHVEDPDKTELKEGAIRLVAGGALLSLPFIYDVITDTVSGGQTVAAPTPLTLKATGTGIG